MAFTEDMTAFFSTDDFAVTATLGAENAAVILDKPDIEVLAGRIQSTDYLMRYAATDLAALAEGSSITVDGSSYTVREIRAEDDGRVKSAVLEAA